MSETPIDPASSWVPVPLRWRHVLPGDVFVGSGARLWLVTDVQGGFRVTVRGGPDSAQADVDPDDRVDVLCPVTEVEAVELSIEALGARLESRERFGT